MLLERKQTSAGSPYSLVKQAGDSLLSVRTQCFAADKAGVGALPYTHLTLPVNKACYFSDVALMLTEPYIPHNCFILHNSHETDQ